jgi:3-deoxy-manno-octulosonate cytidylyltransferase (CMP-KDO synthetase)
VKCVFDQQGNALYFSRSPIPYIRPDRPIQAHAHIGIYGYRTPFLKKMFDRKGSPLQVSEDLEQLTVLENGHRIKIALVDEVALGVDTPQDLVKLERYLCQSNTYS